MVNITVRSEEGYLGGDQVTFKQNLTQDRARILLQSLPNTVRLTMFSRLPAGKVVYSQM